MLEDVMLAQQTCSLRISAETWSTSLNLVPVAKLAGRIWKRKSRLGQTHLSASLAIMAWIPLAESSRVLMKKSLDWKWLWKQMMDGWTWCRTWGWWSRRSSLPRRAPSNPRSSFHQRIVSEQEPGSFTHLSGIGGHHVINWSNDLIHTLMQNIFHKDKQCFKGDLDIPLTRVEFGIQEQHPLNDLG